MAQLVGDRLGLGTVAHGWANPYTHDPCDVTVRLPVGALPEDELAAASALDRLLRIATPVARMPRPSPGTPLEPGAIH